MAHGQWVGRLQCLFRRIGCAAPPDQADSALLQRFAGQRDEAAFEAILHRHGPMVLAVCSSVLGEVHAAEDAFQATFLVLAHKAGSLRKQQALAAWLYGVAYRIAVRARAGATRRQFRERQVAAPAPATLVSDLDRQELCEVLHQEIQQLPEKYRLPVVLCYLQGKSHAETAGVLRLSRVTVTERLAQARARLRERLAGRGFTLPTAVVTATLAAGVRAGVPGVLAQATLQSALRVGQAPTAALISAEVTALVEGALRALAPARRVDSRVLLLALGLLAGGAGVWWGRPLTPPPPTPEDLTPAAAPTEDAEQPAAPRRAAPPASMSTAIRCRTGP